MRCERCGAPIVGNKIIIYNGIHLCDKCTRDLRVEDQFRSSAADLFGQTFPFLGELSNAIMTSGNELDFANANTQIRCPRCKTTLRDVETNGAVGCIECYNTFNETIIKDILKRQGSSEYKGRKPGTRAEIQELKDVSPKPKAPVKPKEADTASPEPEKKEAPKPSTKADLLEKIKKADLGTVSDDDLKEAMMLAAKNEDYDLAVRLRDELKSRKGDN